MQRYILIIMIVCIGTMSAVSSLARDTFGEELSLPLLLQQHCIIVSEGGYIDSCPMYRQDIRDLNQTLAAERSVLLSSGVNVLRDGLESQKNTLIKERIILAKQSDSKKIFLNDYSNYIVTLLSRDLMQLGDHRQAVRDFFAQTYYTQDQSGLALASLAIYKGPVRQYDTKFFLEIGVRNFTNTAISTIEDIYCFTTIDEQDYIYPLGVKQTIDANTIANLVVPLDIATTSLTDLEKERKLFCTIVYTRDGQEVYSNWQSLKFTVNS